MSRKVKLCTFPPSRGAPSLNSLVIQIDDHRIEQVRNYKYLGYMIDDCLNFRTLASNALSKLNNVLFISVSQSFNCGSKSQIHSIH